MRKTDSCKSVKEYKTPCFTCSKAIVFERTPKNPQLSITSTETITFPSFTTLEAKLQWMFYISFSFIYSSWNKKNLLGLILKSSSCYSQIILAHVKHIRPDPSPLIFHPSNFCAPLSMLVETWSPTEHCVYDLFPHRPLCGLFPHRALCV